MPNTLPEALTRAQRIDHQLARAGWAVGSRQVVEEWWLSGYSKVKGADNEEIRSPEEFVDYALTSGDGRPIAIVEAKRTSRDPHEGERQAADYADRIQRLHGVDPFIFLANGNEILFWHRCLYPPRPVTGFFTKD